MARRVSTAELTKYERARVIGARALQLAMGAPPLVKVPEGLLHPVKLARLEFEKDGIPLQVLREGD
jgi:DNA-directed RNA polymerase subunit K